MKLSQISSISDFIVYILSEIFNIYNNFKTKMPEEKKIIEGE